MVETLDMPYTPAHAIVAAPLWYGSKKKLSLPALVIGCMAPDLPYLAHLAPVSSPGHTPLGLITHAVPQGLVLFAIWDVWLEKPILSLVGLRPSQHEQSWIGYFSVVLSLWLGAASHALLDATSHETGWFVQNFSLLTSEIGPFPLFKWIQYGGGIAGLAAIAVWYRHVRQRRYAPPPGKEKRIHDQLDLYHPDGCICRGSEYPPSVRSDSWDLSVFSNRDNDRFSGRGLHLFCDRTSMATISKKKKLRQYQDGATSLNTASTQKHTSSRNRL